MKLSLTSKNVVDNISFLEFLMKNNNNNNFKSNLNSSKENFKSPNNYSLHK